MGKREWLGCLSVGCVGAVLSVAAAEGARGEQDLAADPLRPQLHLTAKAGWINDPNGLSYRNGEWHVFCQHNPKGVQWGNMSWYHFVSRDLVRWTPLTDALTPDRLGAMFSGSAVTDTENTAGFGKGAHVLVYTAMSDAGKGAQCLAWSQDGRNYVKYEGNPVLPNITGGLDRDPRVLWHKPSKRWVMALYVEKGGRRLLDIFTSPDLRKWELASEVPGGSPTGATGWLFECPGLEEIAIEGEDRTAWVIWGADTIWYQVGEFDGRKFTPLDPRVEGGVQMPVGRDRGGNNAAFYAAQTFTGVSRCIWVPWFRNEYREGAAYRHCLGIPQELTLRRTADGLRLVRRPVREFAQLREGDAVPLEKFDGELAEVSLACTLDGNGRAAFDLRGLELAYDAAAGTLSAGQGLVVKWPVTNGRLALTVFLDRGCAEVFSADGLHMMPIPDRPIDSANRRLGVLECRGATGCAFKAWKLNSIWRQPARKSARSDSRAGGSKLQ